VRPDVRIALARKEPDFQALRAYLHRFGIVGRLT
jgi:hypothetical protein